MEWRTLSQDLRGAFEAVPEIRDAVAAYRDPDATPQQRDAVLLEIVRAYRCDRRWSTLLLELLAPAIAVRLVVLDAQPPVMSHEDVRAQFVLEVLVAAASMPMADPAGHVEQRIIRRAAWMVHRRLDREADYQEFIKPLPNEDEEDADGVDEQ